MGFLKSMGAFSKDLTYVDSVTGRKVFHHTEMRFKSLPGKVITVQKTKFCQGVAGVLVDALNCLVEVEYKGIVACVRVEQVTGLNVRIGDRVTVKQLNQHELMITR